MINAKKMVLVDERLLDTLLHKQDTNWRKPVDYKAKTILNSELKSSLDNSIPDDIKAKLYQNNLNRFLHTSKKQTEEQPIIDPIVLPATKKPKKKKTVVEFTPRVKRLIKKPKKFAWSEW